ncbi:ubiquitin C-terminal hydrolase 12-like [Telopea speciosissima]|uniref:ubiquitin C-terminal hydrolase 12-like n=1 Tax=Telopea speciosissima TaxID=54955 RepID=UPI001CC34C9B|nr:ubiquitin C-terminal hydrolase 12-like [Telopea speciosissima]
MDDIIKLTSKVFRRRGFVPCCHGRPSQCRVFILTQLTGLILVEANSDSCFVLQQEDDEMLVTQSTSADVLQPMEAVAQAETATTFESKPVVDPWILHWKIKNFSKAKKHSSAIFHSGGYKWQVLISLNSVRHLSMYLKVADAANLPYGWSICSQFSLAVIDQINRKYTVRHETHHKFNARASNRGFQFFMALCKLKERGKGYIVNDTVIVEAEVAVKAVYDSKTETGYVGLKEMRVTRYMNSLFQTLYHIPYFRKVVYNIPGTEIDTLSRSVPLALQSLFYKVQHGCSSVAMKNLITSFVFMQHDALQFNRVLCEKLEDKMKGTIVEGRIRELFEGRYTKLDDRSAINESFFGLRLDVKGCQDVYASFDKYVEPERFEGDSKDSAAQCERQDARKGVRFIDFPPVLQLQLEGFEYNGWGSGTVKINDRYKCPMELDLDQGNRKYLSREADIGVRNVYTLYSVLVYSDGVHCGPYYAFIRPTLSDQWYKFHDEQVTKEDMNWDLEEQYGGEEKTNSGFNNTLFKLTNYSNPNMLVYVREGDKEKIFCNMDETNVAKHIRKRFEKEDEEKKQKKKEKADYHLSSIKKVVRDEDLSERTSKDIGFDLVDHNQGSSFYIGNQIPSITFKVYSKCLHCISGSLASRDNALLS